MPDFLGTEMNSVMLAVYAIVGLAQCFLGYRLFKFLITINGFFIGAIVGEYLSRLVIPDSELAKIITMLALGLILAIFAFTIYLLGIFLIGALGGAVAGNYLAEIISVERVWLMVGLSIVGGLVALILQKTIIITATSLIGAAAIIYIPYYYLEYGLSENFKNFGQIKKDDSFLVFLAVIALTFLGIFIQSKYTSRKMYGRK